MRSSMPFQLIKAMETLSTTGVIAIIESLLTVDLAVFGEVRRFREAFSAGGTLERFFFGVGTFMDCCGEGVRC